MSEEVQKAVAELIDAVRKLDEHQIKIAAAFMNGMAVMTKEEK